MPSPDLAVLGNLILDDVVLADGTARLGQPGGAALYAALAARLWEVDVGIVSVVGTDYPAAIVEALTERGIDIEGVRRVAGPTLRTWLLYEGRRRRVVHRLDGPTHAEVSPDAADLPAGWRPRAVHLAPMPFAVQQKLAFSLGQGATLSLDPYELVREEALAEWHDLLAGIDLLFLSEDEMELPDGLARPEEALRKLAGPPGRLELLFYKQGAGGGLAFDPRRDRSRRWRPLPTEVAEPTGAGDAFAGGLIAGRLLGDSTAAAIDRGLVSSGFALEGQGPEALLRATPSEAAARLAALPPQPPGD